MSTKTKLAGPLKEGKEIQIMDISTSASGQTTETFSIDAESVLISLYVGSVSGSIDVTVYTVGKDQQETEIISFPTLSSPTSELLLRKAASALQSIKVVAVYTDECEFNIRARGVAAEGASVRIEGASTFQVTQKDVTTSASSLLAASLTDRNGIMIVNHSSSSTIFVAETLAKATIGLGAPIYPNGGNLSVDLSAGSALYAVSASGTADIRIIETGGN